MEAPVVALRRPWYSRVSTGHVFVMVAGVLAFLLNLTVLQGARDTDTFGVASSEIPAGSVLTPELVVFTELQTGSELAEVLFGIQEIESRYGSVVVHSMSPGEPFTPSVLRETAAPSGLRAMSIPVAIEHAAGGRISPGDRIDVVSVNDGRAAVVARDLEVLDVADRERGGIAGPGAFFVVVGVDVDASLLLAEAMATSRIEVLLATGARGSG